MASSIILVKMSSHMNGLLPQEDINLDAMIRDIAELKFVVLGWRIVFLSKGVMNGSDLVSSKAFSRNARNREFVSLFDLSASF